jgi:hypothetical protein
MELRRLGFLHGMNDKKFVGAALLDISDGGQSTIINAVDSYWCDLEDVLVYHGIAVTHLNGALSEDWQKSKGMPRSKRKR